MECVEAGCLQSPQRGPTRRSINVKATELQLFVSDDAVGYKEGDFTGSLESLHHTNLQVFHE